MDYPHLTPNCEGAEWVLATAHDHYLTADQSIALESAASLARELATALGHLPTRVRSAVLTQLRQEVQAVAQELSAAGREHWGCDEH